MTIVKKFEIIASNGYTRVTNHDDSQKITTVFIFIDKFFLKKT